MSIRKGLALAGALMVLGAASASAQEYTIRASHGESTDSALHRGWQVFEAYVESASGGKIAVEIAPAGQLGSMTDALEQAKSGAIQMAHGDEQTMSTFYKPMLILATPYLFANDEEGMAFVDTPFFMETREKMAEESGLRLLAAASYGFRNFTNNVHPIKTAADMEGIRMRVPPSPMSLKMVEAMGGSPTPVPWVELYGAMQSGVVDGQENPTGVALDYSFYQVQKHMTLDSHQLGLNTLMMNEAFFQSLPVDLREIVVTGARMAANTEYGERNFQARVSAVDKLRELGMEVYAPSGEEVETFRTAVKEPMRAYLQEELDPAFVDAVYSEIESMRAASRAAVE
ncbi:TRAP transporter substrate-binding protein [Microbaculum marinisediminis]|uniref:TRAP transporter substrate-binding protein n=1 Tax=Microbaculum marinisediminis TaxID=2931392 RepID=A0AAW5R2Y3_9HYPH|nr:TRAP transporter substrate-binding protein [Microbaculum sp. A6E488]MCT8973735.1 TRAP transporter substrate-binding protein [Microbaculum sp. A6E488]